MNNKKTFSLRALGAIALLCVVSTLLCSCSKGNKFVSDGADFVDKKTDVSYLYAPACYEPIERGEDIYGKTKTVTFYEIKGQDPLKLLCEENGTVFYAEGTSLPTLDKMNISYMEICSESSSLTVNKKVESTADISTIVESYVMGENLYYGAVVPTQTYKIRFADTSLGIYYSFVFVRYADEIAGKGHDFIYNRYEGKFTPAPEILVEYINGLSK